MTQWESILPPARLCLPALSSFVQLPLAAGTGVVVEAAALVHEAEGGGRGKRQE